MRPKELEKALGLLKPYCGKPDILPVLAHVALRPGDGCLTAEATDLQVACRLEIPYSGPEFEATTTPFKALLAAAKSLKGEGEIKLRTDNGGLTVAAGATEITLTPAPISEWPALPDPGPAVATFAADVLAEIATRVAPSADDGKEAGINPVLQAVCLELGPQQTTAVASDTCEIVWLDIEDRYRGPAEPQQALIDAAIFGPLAKTVAALGADEVRLALGERYAVFTFAGGAVFAAMLKGAFPDWREIVRQNPATEGRLTIRRADLARTLQAARPWTSNDLTRWTVADHTVTIEARGDEGRFRRQVQVEADGFDRPCTIGLACSRLLRLLNQVGGERAILSFNDPRRPVHLAAAGDDAWHALVMPMRLYA